MLKDNLGLTLCILIAIASIGFALFSGDPYYVQVVIWVFTNAVLAVTLRFVLLIGELNIATAAFFGIGAYTTAVTSTILDWTFFASLLAAPVIAGIISALFGWVTLRTKGPYFLLISFAFTEIVRLLYTKTEILGGNSGMIGMFPPMALNDYFPAIAVTILAAILFALYAAERSNLGRVFKAIQNNEDIPRSVGLNVIGLKILCFVIASATVGLAGGVHAYTNSVIAPADFTFFVAVLALAYVKIGGEGHIAGPIIGATILTLAGQFLHSFGPYENIFYGAIIIGVLLLMPGGIIGLGERFKIRSIMGRNPR
ncbi:branched-chain amino acid ABC transporter permease [uncultured Sneathiella sp.]|jgi:branched-chain amino acid transport system permease protein|uniref:branched-chain amino acid ABC transporter permease n=1 Tax=uncultured Sneathiella sp. TaxID=879315 RepID=UPI0030D802CB|tara:strand:+ start:1280 stop:2215 length:936 start_codon:yes stop_codon:yes gene_type:complete